MFQCAKKFNIDWETIWKCAKGKEGKKLLSLSGEKTDGIGALDFVPTIALQGVCLVLRKRLLSFNKV